MEKDFFLNFARNAESAMAELTEGPSPVLQLSPKAKKIEDHHNDEFSGMLEDQKIALEATRYALSGDIME